MLLDTSGLLCVHDRSQSFHREACEHYAIAIDRLTHNYVLAEWVALATARKMSRSQSLEVVQDLQNNPDIEVVWVDPWLHERAMNLLVSRQDKSYSLCDAVSFVILRDRKMSQALTTDHHFEQEGFERLLK